MQTVFTPAVPLNGQVGALVPSLLQAHGPWAHAEAAQAALEDYFGQDDEVQSLDAARLLMGQLAVAPEPPAAKDRAAGALNTALSQRSPAFRAALQWPQVAGFGDRLIRQATDPLVDVLADEHMDDVYAKALALLPTQWLRLQAGLVVTETLGADAAECYVQSPFCLQAADRVEHFALNPWVLLTQQRGALLPLTASERARAEKVRGLLLVMHPAFAGELQPVGDYRPEAWQDAVDHELCRLFDAPMVRATNRLFATEGGKMLRAKLPRVLTRLAALTHDTSIIRLADDAVRCGIALIFEQNETAAYAA